MPLKRTKLAFLWAMNTEYNQNVKEQKRFLKKPLDLT